MEKWFSRAIMGWYLSNKRDLPWRTEKDAYKIWLSEIILQQTQVAQGLSYYQAFIGRYPTVKHLARASEDEVLRLWQGLGYYSRARNLHMSAKHITNELKGLFPLSFEEIKQLKGVGDYTASAIASFAYGLPYAVVDGNVYRVLSRVFGIKTPIDSSGAKNEFQVLANELLDKKDPGTYNQAIMEFGSQYCKPVKPDCNNCILKNRCYAFANNSVASLPIKAKKTKITNRYFNYLVVADMKNEILIQKRVAGDIWQGLYEFNLVETQKKVSQEKLFKLKEFKNLINAPFGLIYVSKEYKHILSHQHLYAKFYVIKLSGKFSKDLTSHGRKKVKVGELTNYAFPRLTGKFVDDCDLKEIL